MTDETRRNLDKATEHLIESFLKFDKNKATQLHAGLCALHAAQEYKYPTERIDLYSIRDPDLLHKLLKEHDTPKINTETLPNTNNVPSIPGIPTPGMVAVMFNIVSAKAKNALIAGQAGERTLQAIERSTNIPTVATIKEYVLKDTLYDYGNKQRPARPDIDNITGEPDYLISAKATHHLADLFESSLKLHPAARDLESITKSMAGFNRLATCIFKHAANNLDMAKAPDAAEKIKDLAYHIEINYSIHPDTNEVYDVVGEGMKHLQEILHTEGIITEKEAEDFKTLVNKRLEQIRKMEMV